MTDAGRGVIDLDLDDDNVKRKLRGLDKPFSSAGGKAGSGFGSSFTSKVSSSLSNLGRVVSRAGLVAATGLGALAAAAGGWGLKIAADNETAAVSFKLLLGSAKEAETFLGQLQKFAAETPLDFPTIREAASNLLAVGVAADDVIPIIQTLGDATAAAGTGAEGLSSATRALTQVQQKGKVSAEEILQLAEAGVPAWDALATVLGTDVAGAQEQVAAGTVKAATLFEAIETKAGPALQRTTGLLEVQGQTLSGLLSTLKDTVGQNLGKQLQPLAESIKGLLPDITKLAGTLASAFGGTAANLAPPLIKAFSALAKVVTPVVKSLGSGFVEVFSGLAEGLKAAGPGLASFGKAFGGLGKVVGPILKILGQALGEALTQLAPVLRTLISAFKPLLPILGDVLLGALKALRPLWPVFTDALKQLAPVIAKVAKHLGGELVEAMTRLVPVLIKNAPAGIQLAEAMLDLLDALTPLIGPLGQAIGLFSRFQGLEILALAKTLQLLAVAIRLVTQFWSAGLGVWRGAIAAVLGFASSVGQALPKVITFFEELPGKVIGALSTFATVLIPKGLELLGGFLTGLARKLPELIGFMIALPFALLLGLRKLQDYLVPKAIAFLGGFLTGLVRKLPELVTFMVTLPGKLTGKLIDLASKLIPKGVAFLAGILTGMRNKLPDLISFIVGLPAKLISAFGSVRTAFIDIGVRIVEGIWNGISKTQGWIIGKIGDFAKGLLKGALSAFGIGSPSKLFAEKVGKPIAEGIGLGIADNMPTIPAPTADLRHVSRQVAAVQPVTLGAVAGQQVHIEQFNTYDGVDIDRVMFELGFKLAS